MGIIPAIAMATYTTYKVTMSSTHLRKQHKNAQRNAIVTELRTVNFIDALVSILALQNTLIMVKRPETGADMLVLSAISSAAIYTVIVVITLYLLVKGKGRVMNSGFTI